MMDGKGVELSYDMEATQLRPEISHFKGLHSPSLPQNPKKFQPFWAFIYL